jgi:predicted transcriptional regulator
MNTYVRDVMTEKIISIDCNETIREACELYRNNKIGCLIVTDKGDIVGLVTERDMIERTICMDRDPNRAKIEEIMSTNIKTIDKNERLEKAIGMLKEYKIKKLPVTSNDKLVGIITSTDIAYSRPSMKELFQFYFTEE